MASWVETGGDGAQTQSVVLVESAPHPLQLVVLTTRD